MVEKLIYNSVFSDNSVEFVGKDVTATGWGVTDPQSTDMSPVLKVYIDKVLK